MVSEFPSLKDILARIVNSVQVTLWSRHVFNPSDQGHQEFPPESVIKKTTTKTALFPTAFQPYFLPMSRKSMIWTNAKLSLMVAWSSSVSISCFNVPSSIGNLVCFFDCGNSIVSGTSGVPVRKDT